MTMGKLLSSLGVNSGTVLLAGLLFACPSFAQNITGTILGTVTDASGAEVTGVSLLIANQDTNIEYKAVSAASDYTVTNLPPGTYSVRAELSGFKPSLTKDIVLLANRSARVNIVLSPGSVNQTIEVTAAAPVINSENATVGNIFQSGRHHHCSFEWPDSRPPDPHFRRRHARTMPIILASPAAPTGEEFPSMSTASVTTIREMAEELIPTSTACPPSLPSMPSANSKSIPTA